MGRTSVNITLTLADGQYMNKYLYLELFLNNEGAIDSNERLSSSHRSCSQISYRGRMGAHVYEKLFLQDSYEVDNGNFDLRWNKTNSSGSILVEMSDYRTVLSIRIGDYQVVKRGLLGEPGDAVGLHECAVGHRPSLHHLHHQGNPHRLLQPLLCLQRLPLLHS